MSRTVNGTIGEYTTGIDITATDTDTLAVPQANLEIATTDNGWVEHHQRHWHRRPRPGDHLHVVVTNADLAKPDTRRSPTVAQLLIGATYTATETGGATGFTASGSGSIDDAAGTCLPEHGHLHVHVTVNPAATAHCRTRPRYAAGRSYSYQQPGATVNASLITGLITRGLKTRLASRYLAAICSSSLSSGTIGEYTTSERWSNASFVAGLDGPVAMAVSGGDLFVSANGAIGEYNAVTAGQRHARHRPEGQRHRSFGQEPVCRIRRPDGEYTTSGATAMPRSSRTVSTAVHHGAAGDLFVMDQASARSANTPLRGRQRLAHLAALQYPLASRRPERTVRLQRQRARSANT